MESSTIYLFHVMCVDKPERLVTLQDKVRISVPTAPENVNHTQYYSEEVKKVVESDPTFRNDVMANGEIITDPLKRQSIKLVELSLDMQTMIIAVKNHNSV